MSTHNLQQRLARVNAGTDNPPFDLAEKVNESDTFYRVAAGTGALVSGTVDIATGLNTVTACVATLRTAGTGNTATGATETVALRIRTIVTGAVTVDGLYHSATTHIDIRSVSGTSTFDWLAVGT